MYQTNSSGPQINPGPSLGSLAQKSTRQVNPGPPVGMQQPQGLRNGLPGRGGGLARLMEMYGRPGRGVFGHAGAVYR